MTDHRIDRPFGRVRPLAMLLAGVSLFGPVPALAQGVSRPVVQALPDPAARELADALRDLGRNPQSLSALVAAGKASLALEDNAAAAGFFARASAIAPQDGRVKAGTASVLARQGNGVQALQLFAEAEAAGERMVDHAADRGLAFDLVGDNARAQAQYRIALAVGEDAAITRRLALSQAIAGDQRGAEASLLPLLQRQDLAAYRARAFALAILGKSDEAVTIAETLLPDRLAGRLAPYLRYMPRLTRAQQAAAANLGLFPRAADIGRDDPALAAYAGTPLAGGAPSSVPAAGRGADSRLVPAGEPLGGSSARRTPGVRSSSEPNQAVRTGQAGAIQERAARRRLAAAPPVQEAPAAPIATTIASAPPAAAPASPSTPQLTQQSASQTASTAELPPVTAPPATPVATTAPAPQPVVASAPEPEPAPVVRPAPEPVVVAALETPPPAVPAPRPSFSITAPADLPADPPPQAPAPQEEISLSQAFADFSLAGGGSAPASGAVDITTISPPRERPAPPPSPPAPPPVPSRHWVQVATGRDVAALGWDWRRIKRNAGDVLSTGEAHVAAWGQTNRLVAGPYPSAAAADRIVSALKDKEIDSFRFTSAEGEQVRPLD